MHALEGKTDEAETIFRTVLQENPEQPDAYREWGMMLARQGKFQEADAKLVRALEIDPKSAMAIRGRASVLGAMGRDKECVELFQKADGLQPEADAVSFLHWGAALTRMGQLDEARGKLEAGLRRDPANPSLLNNLGLNLVQTGRAPESGLKLLERAVELRPDDVQVLHNLGFAYLQTGRRDKAKPVLERALAGTPKESPAYALRFQHLQIASGQALPDAPAAVPNPATPPNNAADAAPNPTPLPSVASSAPNANPTPPSAPAK
jgi:tetratricopeptide (TPR) repeat protein